jgi:opacity protein-like surface antigen
MGLRHLLSLLAAATLLPGALHAADGGPAFRLFGGAVWTTPIDDSRARLGGEVRVVELGGDVGWEAGFEWRFSRLLGLEGSIARTSHDVDFGDARLGRVDFEPIFVSLNFHLGRGERSDWWVAPTLALVEWRDAGFSRGVEIDDGRDEAFGGTFGVDWRLDEHWSVTAAVRYVDVQLRFGGGGEVAVDPLGVRLGVGLTF